MAEAPGSLWEQMLLKAKISARPPDCTLVVVGDAGCGKDTLVRALRSVEGSSDDDHELQRGTALEYTYFDVVHPDDREIERDGATGGAGAARAAR